MTIVPEPTTSTLLGEIEEEIRQLMQDLTREMTEAKDRTPLFARLATASATVARARQQCEAEEIPSLLDLIQPLLDALDAADDEEESA